MLKENMEKYKISKLVLWVFYTEPAIYQKLEKKYKIYFDLFKLVFFTSIIFKGVIRCLNGIENVNFDLPEKTFFPSLVTRLAMIGLHLPFNGVAFLIPIQEVSIPKSKLTIYPWIILTIFNVWTLVILKIVII